MVWLNKEDAVPELLKGVVNLDDFEVGRYLHADGKYSYCIRMITVGMSLKKQAAQENNPDEDGKG